MALDQLVWEVFEKRGPSSYVSAGFFHSKKEAKQHLKDKELSGLIEKKII